MPDRQSLYEQTKAQGDAAPRNPIFAPFRKAEEFLDSKLKSFEVTGHSLQAVLILRMWRANELLGKEDYLEQVQRLQPDTVDNNGLTPDDLTETYYQKTGVPEAATNLLLTMVQECEPPQRMQAILAAEEKFRQLHRGREHDGYVVERDDQIVPNVRKYAVFSNQQRAYLHNHRDDASPLTAVVSAFVAAAGSANKKYPRAISREILNIQTVQNSTASREWTRELNDRLLELLGQGLPIVECARRLNAHIISGGFPFAPRTWDEVEEQTQLLLEWYVPPKAWQKG